MAAANALAGSRPRQNACDPAAAMAALPRHPSLPSPVSLLWQRGCLHCTILRSLAMAHARVGMPDLERAVLPTANFVS